MKFRKLILLTLVFTLICTSAVYADSVTQKIKLWVINNKKVEVANGSIVVDNKLYISSDVVSDKLQAIVIWDEGDKKATIYKPNVHMITSEGSRIFGDVKLKDKFKFNTFVQVDSLKADISALKLTISDPYGDDTLIESRKSGDSDFPDGKNDFWITMKDISYNFDSVGSYTLRFWVKPVGASSFQLISEKVISSK
ncbi:hypothetical protein [Cohnella abietis]|uniref:Copper amine oxidase-like N-terminal domain-containing protein n=1 Tax=Cohnella abietis TaxID=2507935 RepID=A0A3T1D923_9BACL|nr:hypothetical protein [Cohnella abietis]BBI34597.1 hypothetical protein KCTCHS21_39960 [Cohnella abietis]